MVSSCFSCQIDKFQGGELTHSINVWLIDFQSFNEHSVGLPDYLNTSLTLLSILRSVWTRLLEYNLKAETVCSSNFTYITEYIEECLD